MFQPVLCLQEIQRLAGTGAAANLKVRQRQGPRLRLRLEVEADADERTSAQKSKGTCFDQDLREELFYTTSLDVPC